MVAKPRKSGGHQQGGIYETQQLQTADIYNEERTVFTMANQIFMRVNEVAEELGLLDRVMEHGWRSLTSKETGRIGGLVTKKRRKEKEKAQKAESSLSGQEQNSIP